MLWTYARYVWYWFFPVRDELCELSPLLATRPITLDVKKEQ